jgi:hypothetical protein
MDPGMPAAPAPETGGDSPVVARCPAVGERLQRDRARRGVAVRDPGAAAPRIAPTLVVWGACGARQGRHAALGAAETLGEDQALRRSWEAWRWPWNP